MKKIKYYYNTHTLRYEKLTTPLRVQLLRIFGFLTAVVFTSVLILLATFRYIRRPEEKILAQENRELRQGYRLLQRQVEDLQQQMDELANRDNQVYRSIFEADPVPDSVRIAAMEKNKEIQLINRLNENELVNGVANQLNNLAKRAAYQENSYKEIEGMVRNKEKLLAAIPAIQPVSNKDLNRIASGFGYRIDPVYKVQKFHAGLDFTAPQGTPIYATADGRVAEAVHGSTGYGNHVVISHGYGYETLYGHMVRIKVRGGETIQRGDLIGWVGSTGKSTGPHCHYEVHKNGKPVDPVYFFYNDLTPDQFDRLVKQAAAGNQSLD